MQLLARRLLALVVVCTFGCSTDERAEPPAEPDPGGGGKADGPHSVELCHGVTADIAGLEPASSAIQACLDATASRGTLELPPGTYRITKLIRVGRGITLRTAGVAPSAPACLVPNAPACAVLRADNNLSVTRGFLQLEDDHVTVEHVVLDGNRNARLTSEGAHQCAGGNNGAGFNAIAAGCVSCKLVLSATINALCGTGFEWNGSDAFIAGNLVKDNGDHDTPNLWADGITITITERARVEWNYFADNSDVDLILGSNRDGIVRSNTVVHSRQDAFAGLMIDNFNGTAPGDFEGARIIENTIACNNRCDYGIEIGPHPWYLSRNIRGGTIAANAVDGARMGISVEGAGTPDAPTTITNNQIGPSPSSARFHCGVRPSSRFNVSPDSVVDVGGGPAPETSMTIHDCP